MGITYGGRACLDPKDLLRYCTAQNLPTPWLGKANLFTSPLGQGIGHGYVLMQRQLAAALQANQFYPLMMQDNVGHTLTLPRVMMIGYQVVTPGTPNDPKAAVLVELTDVRWLAQAMPIAAQYNLRTGTLNPPIFLETSLFEETMLWTWQGMIQNIWGFISKFGTQAPTLPYTPHGYPENFNFTGCSAYDALGAVLARLGLALKYDPVANTFSFYEQGTNDVGWTTVEKKWRGDVVWDSDQQDGRLASIPSKVTVYFTTTLYNIGHEDGSTYHSITINNTLTSGTDPENSATLWDDATAEYIDYNDGNGPQLINQTYLQARAQERANKFFQKTNSLPRHLHRWYRGCLSDFRPGMPSQVAWFDVGDGFMTEVMRRPGELPADTLWGKDDGGAGGNDRRKFTFDHGRDGGGAATFRGFPALPSSPSPLANVPPHRRLFGVSPILVHHGAFYETVSLDLTAPEHSVLWQGLDPAIGPYFTQFPFVHGLHVGHLFLPGSTNIPGGLSGHDLTAMQNAGSGSAYLTAVNNLMQSAGPGIGAAVMGLLTARPQHQAAMYAAIMKSHWLGANYPAGQIQALNAAQDAPAFEAAANIITSSATLPQATLTLGSLDLNQLFATQGYIWTASSPGLTGFVAFYNAAGDKTCTVMSDNPISTHRLNLPRNQWQVGDVLKILGIEGTGDATTIITSWGTGGGGGGSGTMDFYEYTHPNTVTDTYLDFGEMMWPDAYYDLQAHPNNPSRLVPYIKSKSTSFSILYSGDPGASGVWTQQPPFASWTRTPKLQKLTLGYQNQFVGELEMRHTSSNKRIIFRSQNFVDDVFYDLPVAKPSLPDMTLAVRQIAADWYELYFSEGSTITVADSYGHNLTGIHKITLANPNLKVTQGAPGEAIIDTVGANTQLVQDVICNADGTLTQSKRSVIKGVVQ